MTIRRRKGGVYDYVTPTPVEGELRPKLEEFGQSRRIPTDINQWQVSLTSTGNGKCWHLYWQTEDEPLVRVTLGKRGGYFYRWLHHSGRADGKWHGGFPSIKAIKVKVTV